MKQRLKLALLTFIMVASTSRGNASDSLCNPCCGSYEIGAELLIFRPTTCDLMYAIVDPRTFAQVVNGNPNPQAATDLAYPQGSEQSLQPDYRPGFRVFGSYLTAGKCVDITASYSWYHTRQGRCVHPGEGGLWPTFAGTNQIDSILYNPINLANFPDQVAAFAKSRGRFDYDAADLEVGSRRLETCKFWVRGYLGLHFFNLFHQFGAYYQGTKLPGTSSFTDYFVVSRRSTSLWSIGPTLGSEAIYTFCGGLGLGAKFGIGIGAGSVRDYHYERVILQGRMGMIEDLALDVSSGRNMDVIPFLHARLGFNYSLCCCTRWITAEVGYEFRTYFNAIRNSTYPSRAALLNDCENFNLDGVYIRVSAQV